MRQLNPDQTYSFAPPAGARSTVLDLPAHEAEQLLNDPYHTVDKDGGRTLLGVLRGKIYLFIEDAGQSYRAYPITGHAVFKHHFAVAHRVASMLGTSALGLSRMLD